MSILPRPRPFPILLAALLSASVATQSLDGRIERNPDDTVTYTLDIDGPPRGRAGIFAAPFLAPSPFVLPPFGRIWVDPFAIVPITPVVPLDPRGQRRFTFKVPRRDTQGRALAFQSINFDLNAVVRFSANGIAMGHNWIPMQPKPLTHSFVYDTGRQLLRMNGGGRPGARVELRVRRGNTTRVARQAQIGQDCKFGFGMAIPRGVQPGDEVQLLVDGNVVDRFSLHPPR